MSVAIVFPGQGSQRLGMLAGLAEDYPQVRETFQEASDVLHEDLWALAQTGPEDELNETANTQVVMLTADVAVWRVWLAQQGCKPIIMAGHSLGEYAALVGAGAISLEAALSLVRQRASFMMDAARSVDSCMAAVIGLGDADVAGVCSEASALGLVAPANFNAPGQVVIAGVAAAVGKAESLAKARGAKRVVRLPMSVASHCELMRSAADHLLGVLEDVEITPPDIGVVQNASVGVAGPAVAIRENLANQLFLPVRWVDTVRVIVEMGAQVLIECGPGKVLTGLNRRIDRSVGAVCIEDSASLVEAMAWCGG